MGGLLTPLTAGASITYPTSRQPMVLLRTMKQRKVTMMILVPQLLDLFMTRIEREVARQGKDRLWKRMLTVAKYSPYPIRRLLFRNIHQKFGGKLSLIFAGGAPLDPELGKKFFETANYLYPFGILTLSKIKKINYNDAQKEYSNNIDNQTKNYMDFMIQNGVINQSFIEGTFLGDDIAYCNEIRSAIEITLSESKKKQ